MNVLGKVITGIFDSIKTDTREKHVDLIELFNQEKELKKPDSFHLMVLWSLENVMDEVIGDTHGAFFNYRIIEQNLYKLFEEREGSMGCADKARVVAKEFVEYKRTGILPEWQTTEKVYYLPHRGTPELWMEFCDGILQFVHGRYQKYLLMLKGVMELYGD